MRRLQRLTSVVLPAVLAAAVGAAEPAPPAIHQVAAPQRGPRYPTCDAPPTARIVSPYGVQCPPAAPLVTPPGPTTDPGLTAPPDAPPVSVPPESSALARSGDTATLAAPNMAGSFSGVSYFSTVVSRQTRSAQFLCIDAQERIQLSNPVQVPVDFVTRVAAFDASRGTALIAENESPRPQTRVYARYQYFAGVPARAAGLPGTSTLPVIDEAAVLAAVQAELAAKGQTGRGGVTLPHPTNGTFPPPTNGTPPILTTPAEAARQVTDRVLAGLTPDQLDAVGRQVRSRGVHRDVFGFELATWDGRASFGLRVPVFQQRGDGSFGQDDLGDLSSILKAVLWEDRSTGDLLSGGLVVTAPTGPGIETVSGTVRSVLFQPFLGAIRPVTSRLTALGFSGVVFPTDDRDVSFLTTDVGAYYSLYNASTPGALITAVFPAVEAHVITPINHRGADHAPIGLPDIITLTGAVHTVVRRNVVMYGAVVVPVTGPKPFDLEAQAVVDFRF